MNKTIEREFEKVQEIKSRYILASKAGNEDEMEKAKTEINEHYARLDTEGESFAKVYSLYEDSKEKGNEYIDISESVFNAEQLIEQLKENGVEKFTFSSSWSSAVETAWKFTQLGYKLEGICEINSGFKKCGTNECEKKPAYIFSIN